MTNLLGLSTLGCPGLPLAEVATLARRYGIGAVELRCAPSEPVHTGIGAADRSAALADLDGLPVTGLATYIRLSESVDGLVEHVDLARDLGAGTLRLFPGSGPVAAIVDRLGTAVELTKGSGVRLLVETHDDFLTGASLAPILAAVPGVGAIWDALHTWRAGESPVDAAEALAPWLVELQLKDAASPTDRRPLVPGTGAVPLAATLAAARDRGFSGVVVLEHETPWYPDAEPFEAALAGFAALLGAR
ncbi:sugar phosphate isomerase/epimerase family protein [Longispora sp. K20-0274]|uniref:sugar phosphate isomerase/epimerase family protein n=1 Tax=Longispora sp. K20-0274 TaxID=3088255 RepID=UPI00399AC8A4